MPATISPPPAPAKTVSLSPAPAITKATGSSPSPGSTSSPPPPVERPAQDYLSDISNDLADLDAAGEEAKNVAPKRGTDGKFTKPEDKPQAKPEVDKPEEIEVPETEPEKPVDEPKPGTMRALGKAHDAKVKEINEVLRPKIQSLESKVKEYEKTLTELRGNQPDIKPIQEKMSAIEKENAALREEIRFVNYKKHPEFTDKYEKPYSEAWSKAVSEVTQLTMEMEDGTLRKATPNDLLALANAPLDQLDDLAAKWFPKSHPRVIRHVEKIRDLAEAQEKALAEAQKGSTEFESKRAMERQTQDAEMAKTYSETSSELTKKYPKWFAPDEADPAGNEILKKGFDYSSGVFENTPVQINGETRPLTPVEKVKRLAVIKAKAANHDRLAAKVKAKDARIAELETELKGYAESSPPTGEAASKPSNGNSRNFLDDVEADLRKLDR